MSRTDKDRPYRIKTQDETYDREVTHKHVGQRVRCVTGEQEVERWIYKPALGQRVFRRVTVPVYNRVRELPAVCDLDDGHYARRFDQNHCYYSLPFHEARWHTAPPRWYVNSVYHAPNRVRVRDVLRAAVKEWNACGTTDLEVEPRPARHSARGTWW